VRKYIFQSIGFACCVLAALLCFQLASRAQESEQPAQAPPISEYAPQPATSQETPQEGVSTSEPPAAETPQPEAGGDISSEIIVSAPSLASQTVTLDFKEADIQNVLKIISFKSGVNIVTTPDVLGNVSIRLVDVPWETALDVILKTYGYGYQRQGNIILVTKLENMSKIQAEEALQTEIFVLKFLDAQDAQKILISLMSPRGKISVLYTRGQKGWQFGTFKIGKEATSSKALTGKQKKPNKRLFLSRNLQPETSSRARRNLSRLSNLRRLS